MIIIFCFLLFSFFIAAFVYSSLVVGKKADERMEKILKDKYNGLDYLKSEEDNKAK